MIGLISKVILGRWYPWCNVCWDYMGDQVRQKLHLEQLNSDQVIGLDQRPNGLQTFHPLVDSFLAPESLNRLHHPYRLWIFSIQTI